MIRSFFVSRASLGLAWPRWFPVLWACKARNLERPS